MLARFEVRNFRSIAEPVELSLVAIDTEREAAHEMPSLGEHLLTRAAIYGPNASGKSNVLAALVWLVDAVRDSLKAWDDDIPVDPFAFDDRRDTPTEFTVDFVVNGIRFEYLLELTRAGVVREELHHYPEGRARRVFERVGDDVVFHRSLGNGGPFVELLTPTTLLLSLARRFEMPVAARFAQAFTRTEAFGKLPNRSRTVVTPMSSGPTTRLFDISPKEPDQQDLFGETSAGRRVQALDLLRLADLGIADVVVESKEGSPNRDLRTATRRRPVLLHETAQGSIPLELSQESEGTRTWFALLAPVLDALNAGAPVVFDELDASLHPVLSAELVKIFHDRRTNPRGAQLIFSTHDTSLLAHLNRDEVWLTQKRPDGSTELGALADFAGERVRKSANLESAYLHGRYGAIPEIDPTRLRSLGLAG
ncbi:ATP-binding protein [Myceligenerans halotolerans]